MLALIRRSPPRLMPIGAPTTCRIRLDRAAAVATPQVVNEQVVKPSFAVRTPQPTARLIANSNCEVDMSRLRRIRAASILGASWGIAWAVLGMALVTWRVFLLNPRLATPLYYWPRFAAGGAVIFGLFGFAAGTLFALSLSRTARVETVDELSLGYAARWGGIAGALSIVIMPFFGHVPLSVLLVGAAIGSIVGSVSGLMTIGSASRVAR
jgi:hypothetical protein